MLGRQVAFAFLMVAGLLAGCLDDEGDTEGPLDGPDATRSTTGSPEADPADAEEVIAQAEAAGAKVERIAVSEDRSMLPSACVGNPANGCLGGNSQAQLELARGGIDRWIVDLNVTWTATTDLTRTLQGRAMAYYECGVGCQAGGEETVNAASASPLQLKGILGQPVDGSKGFWLIVDAPSNLPNGSHGNAGQDVHIEGTVVAIDDL
ncbi:MAG: hypothetical protein ACYC2H_09530 [Thermoplasmatota archaeon]